MHCSWVEMGERVDGEVEGEGGGARLEDEETSAGGSQADYPLSEGGSCRHLGFLVVLLQTLIRQFRGVHNVGCSHRGGRLRVLCG